MSKKGWAVKFNYRVGTDAENCGTCAVMADYSAKCRICGKHLWIISRKKVCDSWQGVVPKKA